VLAAQARVPNALHERPHIGASEFVQLLSPEVGNEMPTRHSREHSAALRAGLLAQVVRPVAGIERTTGKVT